MKKFSKLMAVLLALVMCLSLLPMAAFADDAVEETATVITVDENSVADENDDVDENGNVVSEAPVETESKDMCDKCGKTDGSHAGTCANNPANITCESCGTRGGHTDECPDNSNKPEAEPEDKCDKCGETGGGHTPECELNPNKAEMPEVNPDNPNGPKCRVCGYTGWHKDGCTNTSSDKCPECWNRLLFGHKTDCSQHPNNQPKEDPTSNGGSFNQIIGDTEERVTVEGKLDRNTIEDLIPATKTVDGKNYVLDEVTSSWAWYIPGAVKNDQSTYSVEDFYNSACDTGRDFLKDISNGSVKVEYALDEDGDGIADKYQAKVIFDNGGTPEEVAYDNLGPTQDSVNMPGNSFSYPYATEKQTWLGDYTPAEIEGKTFTGWEIKRGDESIYTITESVDENGNTVLTMTRANGTVAVSVSSKDYPEGTNLLAFIPLTIEGGNTYTVTAQFKDNESENPETPESPENPETPESPENPENPEIEDPETPLGELPEDIEIDDEELPLSGLMTRAEFVNYLYVQAGSPAAELSTFDDVAADHEYAMAIGWAQANGIAKGIGNNDFAPDNVVTVEQARLFLERYVKSQGFEMPELTTLIGKDPDEILINTDEVLDEFFGKDIEAAA